MKYNIISVLTIAIFIKTLLCYEVIDSKEFIPSDQTSLKEYLRVVPTDSVLSHYSIKSWIYCDTKNLYILSECEIDENFTYGTFSNNENLIDADFLRYQVITDPKNHYSYSYYVFPLGNKLDAIRNSDFSYNNNWSSNYTYESTIDDNHWKSLAKIPFSDLRFSGVPPYSWKIIFTRNMFKQNHYYSIPFVTTSMGIDYFEKAYDIQIDKNIAKPKLLSIRPYLIYDYDILEHKSEFDIGNLGIDLLYEPNFSSKIKLSVNPDFSDTPLDDEIDSYNTKYLPEYEENRFFFIEDINALGINDQLFYSRHVNKPSYAVKFTFANDKHSFGLLSTKDNSISENGSDDYFNVLAFNPKYDFGNIQFTILNRINSEKHNEVLHINPSIYISKRSTFWADINVSLAGKNNQPLSKNDLGYWSKFGYNSYQGNFVIGLILEHMSKNYSMDMGRIYEDNFSGWNFSIDYHNNYVDEIIESFDANIYLGDEYDNQTENLLERILRIDLSFDFTENLVISPNAMYVKEYFIDKYYEKNRLGTKVSYDNNTYIQPGIAFYHLNDLLYTEYSIERQYYIQAFLQGDISRHISYNISVDYVEYYNLKKTMYQDNQYIIFNSNFIINFSNKFSLSSGARFNNFESYSYSDHWGFFSNLSWEFMYKSFLTAGYKNMLDKYEEDFTNSSKSSYIKLSYQF